VHFGKYNGKTILEIWTVDKNWVKWFKEEYKTKDFNGKPPIPTAEDLILRKQAEELIAKNWAEHKKNEEAKNKAENTSEFIGTLKKRMNIPVIVTKVIVKEEYTMVLMTDLKGNVVYTYSKSDLEVGSKYSIIGTPTKHVENRGIKSTYFNRVVIQGKV